MPGDQVKDSAKHAIAAANQWQEAQGGFCLINRDVYGTQFFFLWNIFPLISFSNKL